MNIKKSKEKYNDEDRVNHQLWCWKNDIRIYLKPIDFITGEIVVEDKGKTYVTRGTYRQFNKRYPLKAKEKSWCKEIMLIYTEKYLKYNT